MFKRVMIVGSLVVGIIAMLGTEAIAGCIPTPPTPQYCASWIKGSLVGSNACKIDIDTKGCTPATYDANGILTNPGNCPTTTYTVSGTVDDGGQLKIPVVVTCWQKHCERNPSKPECDVEHQVKSTFLAAGLFSETDNDSACLKKNCRMSRTSATFFTLEGGEIPNVCASGHVVKDITVVEFVGQVSCCAQGVLNNDGQCVQSGGSLTSPTVIKEKCEGGLSLQVGESYICFLI